MPAAPTRVSHSALPNQDATAAAGTKRLMTAADGLDVLWWPGILTVDWALLVDSNEDFFSIV